MSLYIKIQTVDHLDQKYNTIGDYDLISSPYLADFAINIRVSKLGDWRKELLVAIHELVESAIALKIKGIKNEDITAFDEKFEEETERGEHLKDAEPGDDPRAPYYREHGIATTVEYGLLPHLELSESDYEQSMMDLWRPE